MNNLENDVQSLILIYLTSLPNSFFWRQNTGAIKVEDRFIRFGLKGAPDIQGMINGRFIGVEAKRTRNGKQSVDQRRWHVRCEASGGVYILANNVDKVREGLIKHGIIHQS